MVTLTASYVVIGSNVLGVSRHVFAPPWVGCSPRRFFVSHCRVCRDCGAFSTDGRFAGVRDPSQNTAQPSPQEVQKWRWADAWQVLRMECDTAPLTRCSARCVHPARSYSTDASVLWMLHWCGSSSALNFQRDPSQNAVQPSPQEIPSWRWADAWHAKHCATDTMLGAICAFLCDRPHCCSSVCLCVFLP